MTTTSDRNSLRQLEAKIKGLPAQDALLRQRQLFRGAREEARQRLSDLQDALGQVQALRIIQGNPNLLADSQRKKLATVRAKGRELLNLVNEANPESAKFGEKLEAIKRTTKGLSDDAKTAWVELCQGHQERANALRALAQRLSPNLARCLQDLDQLLRPASTNPPTSAESVNAIVEARKALAAEIASLKIDGPVESFLREAQSGNGDPRALLDPTVREYLDAHPALWKSLRVVLS
jgi:hypothetical protein